VYGTPKIQIWPTSAFSPPSVSLSSLSIHGDARARSMTPPDAPYRFPPAVQHVLGLVEPSTLIFLDHNLWVCSFDASTPTTSIRPLILPPFGPKSSGTMAFTAPRISYKRHFFIPHDWWSRTGKLVSLVMNPKV